MRIKLISVRQAKCNFCHQWILVPTYERNSLYTCSKCLQKYQAGAEVLDENGLNHRLVFLSNQTSSYSFKDASTQDQTSFKHLDTASWSEVSNALGSSLLSHEQLQLIQSRISSINKDYEQEAQHILDWMKELSRYKSHIFESDSKEQFLSPKRLNLFQKTRERKRSQDKPTRKIFDRDCNSTCFEIKDVGKTDPYDFYFGQQEIQKFKKKPPVHTPDRSFGTDIINISYDELFLNLKRNQLKTHRSTANDQTSNASLRLSDQQSKMRIDAYLETRYQSTSLHRILARHIKEAYDQTNLQNKIVELVSFNLDSVDLPCYLSLLSSEHLNTLKLINVGLRDEQLGQVIDWMGGKRVQSLVLTGNKLTDASLRFFLNRSLPFLREIYLGKNRIRKQRAKQNIVQIRSKFILYI